jgi:hypothetical protein
VDRHSSAHGVRQDRARKWSLKVLDTCCGHVFGEWHVPEQSHGLHAGLAPVNPVIEHHKRVNIAVGSPARTFVDGFAALPFTRTWPPSHSWVAIGRVFTRRTAHSQRSIRVSAGSLRTVKAELWLLRRDNR